MQKINQLTATWQQWIKDNLARGCTPSSIVESMVLAKFDASFASSAVAQLHQAEVSAIATLPLTQTFQSGSYRYETQRMLAQGPVIATDDRMVHVSFRIAEPVVALLDDLLSSEECDELIRLSRIKLKPSTIVDPTTGHEKVIADRSSKGTFFAINECEFIARLDRRIATVMNWPVENGEGIQILHYRNAGEYKAHFDFFPPMDAGSQVHLAKGGQRVSTLVMYLNDVEAGGETVFPKLGLSVVPKKGSAVYFEYCDSYGQVDEKTLHGGLPVLAGEKWIATKWMRQRPFF